MKIFINPGHDIDRDSGAVNRTTGLREADVARNIGERVKGYLENVGYECKLFQFDSLQKICDEADYFGADLFVSIHCNAANQKARGTETYHCAGSVNGKKLAQTIHNQIVASIPANYKYWDRGVKSAGFYVLKYTSMPAVLVETAFIDNDTDARLLVDYEDEFARAIARGVTDYVAAWALNGISYPTPAPTVTRSRTSAAIIPKVSFCWRRALIE